MEIALTDEYSIFCSLNFVNNLQDATVPLGVATAIHTVPTGFSAVPPSGPATPVVAIE